MSRRKSLKYFLEGKPETEESPSPKIGTEKGGRKLLLMGIWLLLAGFAAPLLLIHLIKSPPLEEHLLISGISYYQMLFVFFLSSALMVYTSLFFVKAKPLTILFFFLLSLLSCFPFVVGLRNDLTLHQVILDIPFFSKWPFFFRPAYILIEFLIPLGIVIYLCLQMMSLFSKRPHHYAFLGFAIYLSVAAFLGISGLSQARQPNIGTALAYLRENQAEKENVSMMGGQSPDLPHPGQSAPPPTGNQLRLSVPSLQMTPDLGSGDSGTGKATEASVLPAEAGEIKTVSKELRLLSEKVDRLMAQLGEMKTLFMARQENGEGKGPVAVTQEKEIEEPSEDKRAIIELRKELRILSDRVDHISDAFGQMGRVLAEQKGSLKKEGFGTGVDRSSAEKEKELKDNIQNLRPGDIVGGVEEKIDIGK
ncbi:MAG: hypothetical protein MUO52_03385 [Desulfobacterales bacterium]|nr:hypothetical protein [Desulfobacterales bacterium]